MVDENETRLTPEFLLRPYLRQAFRDDESETIDF